MGRFLLVTVLAVSVLSCPAGADARLDWHVTVYSDGAHNAFTDLAYFNGAYYLGFRHGETHASLDGEIRVMRSADMKTWEPCGTIDTAGDDRDAKLIAVGDTLYLYFGTWDIVHRPGRDTPDRGSVRTYFSTPKDGTTWSAGQGIYEPGFFLWLVPLCSAVRRWDNGTPSRCLALAICTRTFTRGDSFVVGVKLLGVVRRLTGPLDTT